MIVTVISTGDGGAARGALEAAEELGIPVAGWYPRGSRSGPPSRTRILWAKETLAPRMAARLNVQDSDGTLIVSFAPGLVAGGPAAYADEAVAHQRKASLHIVLPEGGRSTIPEDVRKGVLAWVTEEDIETLHVTGPREAEEPGIQQAVRDALVWIFEDEALQPSPRVQAFAEQVIGSMVAATCGRVACPECRPVESLRAEAEIARIAAEIAAMPSPTRLAINLANVDAAIAAGLEVEWSHPPKVPAEVYAERDRLLGETPAGVRVARGSAIKPEDLKPQQWPEEARGRTMANYIPPEPYGVAPALAAVAAFNRKNAEAAAIVASIDVARAAVDVACSTCVRLCFDGVRVKPGGLVRAGVVHATPLDGPDVPLCETAGIVPARAVEYDEV